MMMMSTKATTTFLVALLAATVHTTVVVAQDASCAAFPLCEGLVGDCCPSAVEGMNGTDLYCCENTSSLCSANSGCEGLDGPDCW